jgi:hypothetical protein
MATACGQLSWDQCSEEPQALAMIRPPHDKETMSDVTTSLLLMEFQQ